MNHTTTRASAALVLLLALATAACSDGTGSATSDEPASSPATDRMTTTPSSPTAQSRGASATALPIDDTWRIRLTRADIRDRLQQAGLASWTEDLFRTDQVGGAATWIWTFDSTAGRARGLWLYPDGAWRTGWTGPLTVEGERLTIGDDDYGTTDTFRWRVDGRQLVLSYVESTGPDVRGIPEKVYAHAYFTTPMTRTTCPSSAGSCEAAAE